MGGPCLQELPPTPSPAPGAAPPPGPASVLPAPTGRHRGAPSKDGKVGANEPVEGMLLDSDPDAGVRGPGV